MSIILKGIDLPTNGETLIVGIYGNGLVSMEYTKPLALAIEINAEAIQIPKVHGNIKDENEIIKRLEEKEKEPLYQHDTDDWWVGIIDAETEVNRAPTILEAEE